MSGWSEFSKRVEMMCNSVLVVDDNDSLRTALVGAIKSRGYHVIGARDGKAALEIVNGMTSPCLIFLDLMMPRGTGWDFLEALPKKTAALEHVVVLMSAVNEKIAPTMKLTRRPVGTLRKPISLAELKTYLTRYVTAEAAALRPEMPIEK